MAQQMHGIVLEAMIYIVGTTNYFSLTCDEVSTIENQSWLLIHAYVVQNWLRIPIFISFKHVAVGLGVDNLTQIPMQTLMHERGLMKFLIGKRLMTFGVDGVFVFQDIRSSVIIQIVDGWAPHFMGVHCMAHITNLVVQTLSHLQMVSRIEGLFQTLHNYFSKSLKRHLEFMKFA
jgi:hypothetical protein